MPPEQQLLLSLIGNKSAQIITSITAVLEFAPAVKTISRIEE